MKMDSDSLASWQAITRSITYILLESDHVPVFGQYGVGKGFGVHLLAERTPVGEHVRNDEFLFRPRSIERFRAAPLRGNPGTRWDYHLATSASAIADAAIAIAAKNLRLCRHN